MMQKMYNSKINRNREVKWTTSKEKNALTPFPTARQISESFGFPGSVFPQAMQAHVGISAAASGR
jgi:hypothetical protein